MKDTMLKIFYGDSTLFFYPAGWTPPQGAVTLGEGESFANIIENLEKYKLVALAGEDPEVTFKSFCGNFRQVDAAGGLVKGPGDKLLLIHRNGRWDLPKGHLEPGEDLGECALREVEEETGVRAGCTEGLVCTTFHFYTLDGEWVLKRTSWYGMSSGDTYRPVPQTAEGISDVEWVPRGQVAQMAGSFFPSVREVLRAGGWLAAGVNCCAGE